MLVLASLDLRVGVERGGGEQRLDVLGAIEPHRRRLHRDLREAVILEIHREINGAHSTVEIEDALAQLRVIGLIHKAGDVVHASQAAAHMDRLEILAI